MFSVLEESKLKNLWLISKWGCDCTSGQAEYKQLFEIPDVSDASIFISSLVPVQIVCGNPSDTHEIIELIELGKINVLLHHVIADL